MGCSRLGFLVTICTIWTISVRCALYVITPTWLDYFSNKTVSNSTREEFSTAFIDSSSSGRGISVYFVLCAQYGFATVCYGLIVMCMVVLPPCSKYIGPTEKAFPKRRFLMIGPPMAVSSLLFNMAMSGSRTAPYLQGILANCNIPIQFIVGYLLLRKSPTLFKIACTGVIILMEFICLLPTIFPQLESRSAKHDDGGASGIGAVLWPMCAVLSMVPFAITNTLTERAVQETSSVDPQSIPPDDNNAPLLAAQTDTANDVQRGVVVPQIKSKQSQLNIFYFQFWFSLFAFVTSVLLFWADIIPGFGTSDGFADLKHKFLFDCRCMLGLAGCSWRVVVLGWANLTCAAMAAIALPLLMRYSEGANYVIVALTLRTPIVLIFWSLFEEPPFHWHPHIHLSTWLSIGAIVFMIPAVALYESGENLWASVRARCSRTNRDPETDTLIESRS